MSSGRVDIERLDAKLKAMKTELKAAVLASGSHLIDIHGIGPRAPRGSLPTSGAGVIMADEPVSGPLW